MNPPSAAPAAPAALHTQPGAAKRVLSIQSHVVSGYVGNKAAVFPLQLLGWNVDVVNTVQYSNHSGYGRFGGPRTPASDLAAVFAHLEQNGLLHPARVLTGYIPDARALDEVGLLIRKLKQRHGDLIYLLDPVMGDAGKLYVAPDVLPLYRALLSSATVITPNYFEVELLTNVPLTTCANLREALRILHVKFGVANVVVSSMPLSAALRSDMPSALLGPEEPEELLCICSARTTDADAVSDVHGVAIPRISGYFSGVGDLFSALVLAHYEPGALQEATGKAVWTVQAILRDTEAHAAAGGCGGTDSEEDNRDVERIVRRMAARELRVIENAGAITRAVVMERMGYWTEFWR